MRQDRGHQVRGPAIVQEEDSLPEAPQRRSPKLPRARLSLADAVGQANTHVMDQKIGKEIHWLVAQGRDRGIAGGETRRVAVDAPGGVEDSASVRDRVRSSG